MIRRLRIKFVCITMSIVTVILAGVMVAVLGLTRASLERESLETMYRIARDPVPLQAPDEEVNGMRLPYFVLEVKDDGTVQSVGGGYYDLSDTDFLQQAADEARRSEEASGVLPDYNLQYLRVSMPQRQYIVFADLSNEVRTLNGLMRSCLIICGAAFVVFFFLSTLLARWAVRPVEKAWVQQKQFVADASHELKTPLTVILTDAELLCTPEGTATEKAQISQNMLTVAQQMRTLVEQLLELARVDQGLPHTAHQRTDWSAAVTDALLPFEPLYYEKGLGLDTNIEPGIAVRGDAAQLGQLTGILLDNAQKYSTPGGTVHLALCRSSQRRAVLAVTNCGDPITPEDLHNIFKRFYRADPAHRRDGSSGLGLAIAKGIAEQHGGRIWATSENGINTFYVSLKTL